MDNGSTLPSAVIDTNLVVSGVVIKRGRPLALIEVWRRREFRWLVSGPVTDEYADVLRRPELLREFGARPAEMDDFLYLIALRAERVQPSVTVPLPVRDAKDEKLLAAALGGNADYLVTGDKDLLVLADDPRLGTLRIVTVAEFLEIIGAS